MCVFFLTSHAAFPIWHPACPTWMEMTSRMIMEGKGENGRTMDQYGNSEEDEGTCS